MVTFGAYADESGTTLKQFYNVVIILLDPFFTHAGNKDSHKSLDEFKFQQD